MMNVLLNMLLCIGFFVSENVIRLTRKLLDLDEWSLLLSSLKSQLANNSFNRIALGQSPLVREKNYFAIWKCLSIDEGNQRLYEICFISFFNWSI